MAEDPRSIGPYRMIRRLGQGGMGVVYQAVSAESGHIVALKTVRVARPSMLAGIRREIHLLARLQHPGVVRVLSEGVHGGLPWYAMELLDGTTLRQYAGGLWRGAAVSDAEVASTAAHPQADATADDRRWWTTTLATTRVADDVPEPPPASAAPARDADLKRPQAAAGALGPVLTVVRRLCEALAYLHGEGLVHRDLKPENILMRPDGHPVLVDFGLMSRFGADVSRDALVMMSEHGGTLSYMAPEQAAGELVDARADLYSLGCILYELLTGRPPFLADTPAQLLWMHRNAEPVPPATLVHALPHDLEGVILRLLAKDRRERLGYADVVAAALTRLGAQAPVDHVAPPRRSYLYRPRLAGRQVPLQELEACVHDAREGHGGLVLLAGQSGVGKTRLAMEVASRASRIGVPVHTGECRQVFPDPEDRGKSATGLSALRPLLQAVADLCRERGAAETERLLGRRARVLSLYEPALTGVPGLEALPELPDLPPEAARLRLMNFLADTLGALCVDGARLLVLDDLQWADDLTLGLLSHLHRTGVLGQMALLIIGTYRTDEAPPELTRLLQAAPPPKVVRLERLDEDAVAEIVGDMLALFPAPSVLARFLTAQAEGNPFFVAEYLRAAVAEGLLYRDEEGYWRVLTAGDGPATTGVYAALPLPTSLRELLHTRLSVLHPAARTLLEAASVLGREMDPAILHATSRLEDVEVLDGIGELIARQVMEETEDGRYRFPHERIREVAYAQLDPERRRELHRLAAQAMAGLPEVERGPLLGELGRHWERAGEHAEARHCYLKAAQGAAARYSLDEAEAHYRAYLALVTEPSGISVATRHELGTRVLAPRGRLADALAQHDKAREEARQLGDRGLEGLALRHVAEARRMLGAMDEAAALFRQALDVARALGNVAEQCSSLGGLALIEYHHGRFGEFRRLLEESLALARDIGDRRRQGIALTNLAVIEHEQGRIDQANDLYEQTLAIARETGDRSGEGLTLLNLAILDQDRGALAEGRSRCEQALAIHREVGDRYFEAITLGNLGDFCRGMGDWQQARILQEQSVAILRQVGNPEMLAQGLAALATLELEHFSPERADELSASAEGLLRDNDDTIAALGCLCCRGHVNLAHGRPADTQLARAREIRTRLQVPAESRLGALVARLERAVESVRAGSALVKGYAPVDAAAGAAAGAAPP